MRAREGGGSARGIRDASAYARAIHSGTAIRPAAKRRPDALQASSITWLERDERLLHARHRLSLPSLPPSRLSPALSPASTTSPLAMSSDVLIDIPDAPSPRSTASDDADAVNTESARVYFGPLQSPEKKFASASRAKTPIKRSTRLSSTRIGSHSHADDRARHPSPTRLNIAERGSSSGDEDTLQDGEHALRFVFAALMLRRAVGDSGQ